ncbi:MAG: TylF/MycF/NovP-related O-methyltransferase [Paracoccaceae bacterium]
MIEPFCVPLMMRADVEPFHAAWVSIFMCSITTLIMPGHTHCREKNLGTLHQVIFLKGFCIVDDHLLPNCVAVIHDYRDEHGIEEELIAIDKFGAFWRKT